MRASTVWMAAALLLSALPTLAAVQYESDMAGAGLEFQQAGELHSDPLDDSITAFIEIIGGGACFADFDGDGLDDLYLVSQQYNPENEMVQPWIDRVDPHNKLYINDGDGTFTDRTDAAGVASRAWGLGCSAADYDGDGRVDLFVTNYGSNELFRNEGDGVFANVTDAAGVGMQGACGAFPCMSTNSAWADYDRDGDLDLYVGNYVDTDLLDEGHGPGMHTAQPNFLHRNNADGTFTEVGVAAGVQGVVADVGGSKTFGVVWFDYDLDGWMDIYVANDMEPNNFFVNQRDGTFLERGPQAGIDDGRAGMGLAISDYDGDGYPDIFITHFVLQDAGFYRNRQDGTFDPRSGEDDLHALVDHVGWGTSFVDFDRDTDLDILVVNGHTALYADDYAQPTKAFRNDPEADPEAPPWDRLWVDVSDDLGPGLADVGVSRGAAFADFDLDGDTDLFINNNANATAQFLRASGVENHWLNVRLSQPGENRFGIGAKVKLEAGGLAQHREVQAGSSYLSQNTLQLEFGLGDGSAADRITVTWPDGGQTVVEDVAADQTVRIDRATASVTTDVLSPLTTFAADGVAGQLGWYRSDVDVVLSSIDRGAPTVSGIASTQVAVGDGAWSPYVGQVLSFEETGVHLVRGRATDLVGNVEPRRTEFVGIDRVAPTIAHLLAGTTGEEGWWVEEPVVVTLDAADDLSGVHEIKFRIDDGAWQVYGEPFEVGEDGEHSVEFFPIDRAGNVGSTVSLVLRIDRTAPERALVTPASGAIYVGDTEVVRVGDGPAILLGVPESVLSGGQTHVVRVVADDAVSGMSRVLFFLDGEPVAVARGPGGESSWSWDLADSGPGHHVLLVFAVDKAGNIGPVVRDVVVVPPLVDRGLPEVPAEGSG